MVISPLHAGPYSFSFATHGWRSPSSLATEALCGALSA